MNADQHAFLRLTCARCERSGLVRWDRLDRLLHCKNCMAFYRVGDGGELVEVPSPAPKATIAVEVRTLGGGWQKEEIPDPQASMPGAGKPRGRSRRWRWLAGLAAVLLAGGALAWLLIPSGPRPLVLPPDLESRARLWADCWLASDLPPLVALTDPSQDRALRRWLSDHPAPGMSGAPQIRIERRSSLGADVTVNVNGVVHSQKWVEKNGTWLFQPAAARGPRPATQRPAIVAPAPAGTKKRLPS